MPHLWLTRGLAFKCLFENIPDENGNRDAQTICFCNDLFAQILGDPRTQIFFFPFHRGAPRLVPHFASLLPSELPHLPREILHKITPRSP